MLYQISKIEYQKYKPKSPRFSGIPPHSWRWAGKNSGVWVAILSFALCILNFNGCATVPSREAFPTYHINGLAYLPLVSLCESKGINWEYDTFARTVNLSKDFHKINLTVGDTLVLVDGNPVHLKYPVDIYEGMVVVPYKFKEQILESLFKENYPSRKTFVHLPTVKKVVIDAGHGGGDPGAIGRSGLREKDINLDLAKRLAQLLRASGVNVVMTRSTDEPVLLSRRVDIANNAHPGLFISIHTNANRVRSLNGFEVYYVSPNVDDSRRALMAAANATLDFDSSCFASDSLDLRATLWDMIYTYNRAASIELARDICKSVDRDLNMQILGIKSARFEVLRDVHMPALLIEIGFLSNNNEERMLRNNYYRQRIAEGIAQGISNYAQDLTLTEATPQ
jgi:N-acetylmuramoyl-L-alanine amidase